MKRKKKQLMMMGLLAPKMWIKTGLAERLSKLEVQNKKDPRIGS
jgi:hypothetical protein